MVKVLRLFFIQVIYSKLQNINYIKFYDYHTKFYEVYQNQYFALLVIIKE